MSFTESRYPDQQLSTNGIQVPASRFVHSYDNMKRFASYWAQIEEVTRVTPAEGSVLEIGVGTGLTSWYLERNGLRVASLDHDPDLKPTVAADLLALPFAGGAFDTVAAFQVLEHLPFQSFAPALQEFGRVSADSVIISLPDSRRDVALAWTLPLPLPRFRAVRRLWSLPWPPRREVRVKGKHFWEIGVEGYPMSRIVEGIEESGLTIRREFRLFEFPFH